MLLSCMTNTTDTPWLLNTLCVTLALILHMCLAGLLSSTSECSTKMSGPRNTIAHLEHMNMVVAMKSGEKPGQSLFVLEHFSSLARPALPHNPYRKYPTSGDLLYTQDGFLLRIKYAKNGQAADFHLSAVARP